MKTYGKTIYEVSGTGVEPRYFPPHEQTDACVRASELVTRLDADPALGGAWVALKRLPDSVYPEGMTLMNWTKTSNERPTSEGVASPDAA